MQAILEKLRLIKENPGYFKGLTPEEQAELFLVLLTPKKKVFQKPKIIQGIDGKTPIKDKDYLSKESALAIIEDIKAEAKKTLASIKIPAGKDGANGKDAEITPQIIEYVIQEATKRVPIPKFPYETIKMVTETRDLIAEIESYVADIKDDVESLKSRPIGTYSGIGKNQVYNWIRQAVSDGTIPSNSATSFETVSKNLDASGATLNYTGDNLTSIVYANGITKTLNYTGDNLTSVVLSGSTPSGISLTKTLSYTGDNLTGVAYS